MDKIIIKDLSIFAHHGVNKEEKEKGQPFLVDAVLCVDTKTAGLTDDLESTVNYSLVVDVIEKVMLSENYNLLERVAQLLCDAILGEFKMVDKIILTVKKPQAPIKAEFNYVAVEITRKQKKKRGK